MPAERHQETQVTDPSVLIVPGAGVQDYARPAVRALRARGIEAELLPAPGSPHGASDLSRYGTQLAGRIAAGVGCRPGVRGRGGAVVRRARASAGPAALHRPAGPGARGRGGRARLVPRPRRAGRPAAGPVVRARRPVAHDRGGGRPVLDVLRGAARAGGTRRAPRRRPAYRAVDVLLFQHGACSEGIAGPDAWLAVAAGTAPKPDLLALDPRRFPHDVASLGRYDRALAALPRATRPWTPLGIDDALDGLAAAGLDVVR